MRTRSPGDVVGEIKETIAGQRERFFYFYDDCFTFNRKWLMEFCDYLIKDKVRINWDCISSANLVDEKVFEKIKKAGCVKINIAVESGSQRVLDLVNKRLDFEVVKRIFSIARKYRISTAAYMMIGFPTETEADIRLTQKIIREIYPNWVYCSVFLPLPGTVCYQKCVEYGLVDPAVFWRDSIENIAINYTGTMGDMEFFELVNETFRLCYKINTAIFNIARRAPFVSYLKNPPSFLVDTKRIMQYLRKR